MPFKISRTDPPNGFSSEITEIKRNETLRENHKYENLLAFVNVAQYIARYSIELSDNIKTEISATYWTY